MLQSETYNNESEIVWSMILLGYAMSFIGPFTSNAVISIIPTLENTFSVSIALISLSITLYLFPFSLFQLFSGAISDRFGLMKGVLTGLTLFALSSFYVAIAPDIYHFIIARALQGVGAAFLYPSSMAILGEFSTPEKRGRIMSGFGVATTAGVSSGPLIAGFFAAFNWRLFFFILTVVSIMITLAFIAQKRYLMRSNISGTEDKAIVKNIITAIHDLRLIMLGMMGFLIFFMRIAFYTYLSETLSKAPYFYDPLTIGSYISVAGFAGLLSSPVAGYLDDKIGKRKTILIGSMFLLVPFILYFTINWVTYLLLLVVTMSFGITLVFITFSIITVEINPKLRPTYSSVYNAIRFLGYSLGPTMALPIFLAFEFTGVIILCLSVALVILFLAFTNFMKQFG